MSGIKLGAKIIEGKTKIVCDLPNEPGNCILISKDRITAGDGTRADDMAGKAAISNQTACQIFAYLNRCGVKTHFVRQHDEKSLVARKCDMIPIEWVARRLATGSFLKRMPGVKEGYRFNPPKLETFFKDDANHDPQWSSEQLIEAKLTCAGLVIGPDEVEIMLKMTRTVFEVLERGWQSLDCSLIDMKVEFGVDIETKELILADLIDSDSWRLWPSGDKRLMVDKQVYRNLHEVTPQALESVKRNFKWVAEQVKKFVPKPISQVVILMGSASDRAHCDQIKKHLAKYQIPTEMRITSAHKNTDQALNIMAEYEGLGVPLVFIAVAGRSNGLGPVTSGNVNVPTINCPPVTPDWGAEDIWSSMRVPSGLGCTTVLFPEAAALAAAQILGLRDHVVWSTLRCEQMNTWIGLKHADKEIRKDQGLN
ncbi:multifunctional protein ADE2-like isoform X2 [Varroa jacobsoni]|uniref:multifunctional protein ADE2-like isoform X2 n=1 Tax=Varroa jacobsoni TaxID=62625 RepID=UPI000BF950C2|nr:multifunctional protein ADE2-like isoform X2 [Varroa jacobsoni]